jgi:hypothetical protein
MEGILKNDSVKKTIYFIAIVMTLALLYLYFHSKSPQKCNMQNSILEKMDNILSETPYIENDGGATNYKEYNNKFDKLADKLNKPIITRPDVDSDEELPYYPHGNRTDVKYNTEFKETPSPLDDRPDLSQCQPCKPCVCSNKKKKVIKKKSKKNIKNKRRVISNDSDSESNTCSIM